GQLPAQLLERAVQRTLYGVHRHLHEFSDLGRTQIFFIAQDHHHALLLGQRAHGLPQPFNNSGSEPLTSVAGSGKVSQPDSRLCFCLRPWSIDRCTATFLSQYVRCAGDWIFAKFWYSSRKTSWAISSASDRSCR